jgi:hypothetical protein
VLNGCQKIQPTCPGPSLSSEKIDKMSNRSPSHAHSTSLNNTLETSPTLQTSQPSLCGASMANFAMDPTPFVPPAMFLEDGGPHCRARTMVYISSVLAKTHEEYTIAITESGGGGGGG